MDTELARVLDPDIPKLNPHLANGLATYHMQDVDRYIDDVFRTAAKDFPEGLTYAGCQRCTPREEFREATRKRNTRRGIKKQTRAQYETAQSSIYLMKYFFKFNGEPLTTRFMYLPAIGQAGSFVLGGSRFNISPVLSDRVISIPSPESIFVRLLRDKFTFQRFPYYYKTGEDRRETVQIVHSQIYHSNNGKKLKPAVPALTTAAHYLFCKYGMKETFKRFAGVEPIVMDSINRSEWPEDQWVICESRKIQPKCFGRLQMDPTKLIVVVPADRYTPMVKALVAGFFYVVDHFPAWGPQYLDNPRQWMLAMGHMLFYKDINHGRLYDDVANHIESLDEYIDPIVRSKMAEIDVHVQDMYEFLAFIIENFNNWLLTYSDKINSMYDKELNILYYVLYDITSAIFKTHFRIKAAAKKGLKKEEIDTIIGSHLKPGLIHQMKKRSGVVSSNSYSGDNKAFKITSTLVPQSSSSAKGKNKMGDRAAISDPSKKLHISIAEFGSYSGMQKSEPTGRGRINHNGHTDHKGVFVRNPKFREMLDAVEVRIKA